MEWSQFGMKWPLWNEWSQSRMNWLKWPFFMGTHGKTIPWIKCLLFTPPALTPAGHKNRQALHRTGFGPKMMKKQPNSLYPSKPALPKPRLRLRPAGIRTGRHPGLDQALARWFRTWDCLGMRLASKKCGLERFPYSIYIYIIYALVVLLFRLCHEGDMQKFSFSSTQCRQYQDEYVLHYVD